MPEEAFSLAQIRAAYQDAVQHGKKAQAFEAHMRSYQGTSAIHIAYQASSLALQAHHTWHVIDKYHGVREALKLMRQAVKRDPANIEIRFLRFAIQHYLPAFLGMSQELEEDKNIIVQNIQHYQRFYLDASQVATIIEFLTVSKRCSPEELAKLTHYLPPSS